MVAEGVSTNYVAALAKWGETARTEWNTFSDSMTGNMYTLI